MQEHALPVQPSLTGSPSVMLLMISLLMLVTVASVASQDVSSTDETISGDGGRRPGDTSCIPIPETQPSLLKVTVTLAIWCAICLATRAAVWLTNTRSRQAATAYSLKRMATSESANLAPTIRD